MGSSRRCDIAASRVALTPFPRPAARVPQPTPPFSLPLPPSPAVAVERRRSGSDDRFEPSLRTVPNGGPVFLARVLIDLDGKALFIEPVTTIPLRPRDPVFLAGGFFGVIRLEASSDDSTKNLVAIKDGSPRAIEGDSSDSGSPGERTCFSFDLHEARFHGGFDDGAISARCQRYTCALSTVTARFVSKTRRYGTDDFPPASLKFLKFDELIQTA